MKLWSKWSNRILIGATVVLMGFCLIPSQSGASLLEAEIPPQLESVLYGFGTAGQGRVDTYASKLSVGPGTDIFGGSELTMLANQTDSQMMSVVIETSKGSLIVIDGGTQGDTAHLKDAIVAKGGRVSAWLVTHPHSDHIGALTEILNEENSPITIDHVYYSITDQSWYDTNEAYRADMVQKFRDALNKLPPDKRHGDITKGQEIWVDDVRITVMNEPYLFETNSINNSSVGYKLIIDGVSVMFLGDMGPDAGARFLAEHTAQEMNCDILQMTHHGQYGLTKEVYEAIRPQICLWPTPDWLWNNDNGGGENSGPWTTKETIQWMKDIGVKVNYCIKDGDQILK